MKTIELSAETFLREWAKDTGPRGAAAQLVLLQIEDYQEAAKRDAVKIETLRESMRLDAETMEAKDRRIAELENGISDSNTSHEQWVRDHQKDTDAAWRRVAEVERRMQENYDAAKRVSEKAYAERDAATALVGRLRRTLEDLHEAGDNERVDLIEKHRIVISERFMAALVDAQTALNAAKDSHA